MLTIEDILARAKALETGSGVYFLIRDGVVVYVGQSSNVVRRIASHVGEKDFDIFAWTRCSSAVRVEMELDYIDLFMPEYNCQGQDLRKKRLADAAAKRHEARLIEKQKQKSARKAVQNARAAQRNALLGLSAKEIDQRLSERMAYLRAKKLNPNWPSPFVLSPEEIRERLINL